METKQLKRKVLSLALMGRLVPQDPTAEPAIELLRRINPKFTPPEYDNPLPQGWSVATLKDICTIISSRPYQILQSQIKKKGKYPVVSQSADINNGYSDAECALIHNKPYIIFGDHTRNVKYVDFDFIVGADGVKIIDPLIDNRFAYFLIMHIASCIRDRGYERHFSLVSKFVCSIPPLAEQKRIVERIEEIFKNIDNIGEGKETLRDVVKKMRRKILTTAISGGLVPQNPADEPAIELLKRINPKFTPPKYDNPLPQGWSVATLSTITTLANGVKIQNKEMVNLDAEFLRSKAKGTIRNEGKFVPANSLVILVDGENSGEVFRTPIDGYQGSTFKILTIDPNMYEMFVQKVIDSHRTKLRAHKVGSAKPHLNKKLFYETIVLIPPLAEQKRIVERIEKLFAVLDSMEVAQTSQGQDSNA